MNPPDSPAGTPAVTVPLGSDPSRVQWKRRQIVGLLVLGFVLAALLGGAVAWQHGAFRALSKVYFIADDVTGLTPGATVRLSGFRIGKVSSMELQPDLKVRVELTIDAEPFAKLKRDARADLVREQLKPAAIALRPGTAAEPLSADDPHVAYRHRGTLTDIAEDLRARLAPILDDVRHITAGAREHRGDIEALLANAREVSQQLAGTAQHLHAISGDLRQRVGQVGERTEAAMAEAQKSLARVGTLIGQAERSIETVNARLPGMLSQSETMLTHLDAVLRDSRTISGAAATGLPSMMKSAAPLLDDSRDMVQGLRQSWPLRDMLPPPPPPLLPIDSHDSQTLRLPEPRR